MRRATFTITGASPYSPSRVYTEGRREKESADDHDERVWRTHCYTDKHGECFIPPSALKNCLDTTAQYLGIKIPGAGQKTWTKKFEAGVLVIDPMMLGVNIKDAVCEKLFLNADGKRGGGKRVWKRYPVFADWTVQATVYVPEMSITRDVFEEHLRQAGQFIGFGRFRPQNRGYYGRWTYSDFQWVNE